MSRFAAVRSLLLVLALILPVGVVVQPAQAATGTSLTLASSIRGPLSYGDDGHFKARLKTTSGKRLGSRPVSLWGRTVGTTTWQKLGRTRTMTNGLALFFVPGMTRSTELQARFSGGSGYSPTRSAVIVQKVRAPLTGVTVSPEAVFSGDVVTVQATTDSVLAGSDVVVERYEGLNWTEVGRAVIGPGGSITVSFPAGDSRYDAEQDSYWPHEHRVRTLDGALAPGERSFSITPRPWGFAGAMVMRSVGEQFSVQLEPQGGTAPFVFEVVAGALAPGVSLSPSGLVSGSTSVKGAHVATVEVTDADGRTDTGEFTLHASGNDIVITTSSFPDAVLDQYYEAFVDIQGAVEPSEFVIEGLPEGLNYAMDGTIWGHPQETGDFSVLVHVYDSDDNYSAKEIPLHVSVG